MKIPLQARQLCSLVYVALHLASHFSAKWFQVMPGISIWYAPAGLAMALLFLLGPAYWPLVLGANVVTAYLGHGLPEWWAPLLFPTLVTFNYCFFAWLGRLYFGQQLIPDTFNRAASFMLIMIAAPAVLACLGTALTISLGFATADTFVHAALRWWVGDFCGLLTVVPVAAVFAGPLLSPDKVLWQVSSSENKSWFIIALQLTLMIAVLVFVFSFEPLRRFNAFYICFLPLIWVCLDHGLPGATLGTLITTMGGLIGIHVFGDGSEALIVNFLLFVIAVSGVSLGLGAIVTSRHAMQQRFLVAQKMESLGVLAGGIAHDFNNLLTVVLGNASLARLDAPENSPIIASIDQIEIATRKASELCQQMLAYAGKASVSITNFDLHELAAKSIGMLGGSVQKDCRIILQPTTSAARVMADENQVRQVLVTLLINASEAIGAKPGRVIIRTERRHFFKDDLRNHYAEKPLDEGDYAVIEVEDNGCGMPAEVLHRIFEPFFSTKFIGKGMGLAAVLGIVKANRGGIAVRSEAGVGTRFQLVFPLAAHPQKPTVRHASKPARLMGGRVLIVDDDAAVRAVLIRSLNSVGFQTVEACDGLEAVELFERHHTELSCVITDLAMPRMDGAAAFTEMHRINPRIPVVLMSAYDPKRSLESLCGIRPAAFLAKPFDLATLEARLGRILAGEQEGLNGSGL